MELMKKAKTMKGNFSIGDIGPIAIVLVVAIIMVAVGAMILGEMNETVTDANASAVLSDGLSAISDFSSWFDTIVVVIVAVILLGLVYMLMQRRGSA